MEKPYRKNVGIMLINDQKKVWMGFRADKKGWQMPQGGINTAEDPLTAIYRETLEEIGIDSDKLQLLAESKQWYSYDFPFHKKGTLAQYFKGQTQKWFLFRFLGKDSDFNLQQNPKEIEFSTFKWEDLSAIVSQVTSFKQQVYQQVVNEFGPIIMAQKS